MLTRVNTDGTLRRLEAAQQNQGGVLEMASTNMRSAIRVAGMSSTMLLMSTTLGSAETFNWLTVRGPEDPVVMAAMDVLEEYQETNPDFDIEIETISNRPAYLQKVKILATSGELPELFDADAEPYFADIVEAGLVANVGEILDELGITDRFIPFALDYERLDDGSLYLIPFQSNVEYFYYHPELFEAAGVEPPETIDGFLDVCTQIGEAGITPIAVAGRDGWPMYRYLSMPAWRRMGNEFLDQLRAGEISMNSEVGLESSQYFQDLGQNCFQEGFTSADYTAALDMFLSKQAAIYYIGTWELHSLLDENGELADGIEYFKMPVIEGEDATAPEDFYAHSGIGTAIRADAATDELKGYLSLLAERFGEISLYDYNGLSSIKTEINDELPPIYGQIVQDMEEVGEYTKVWDVKLDAATVDTLFRQSQLLGLGQITPEQFGEEIDRSIQQYLQGR